MAQYFLGIYKKIISCLSQHHSLPQRAYSLQDDCNGAVSVN